MQKYVQQLPRMRLCLQRAEALGEGSRSSSAQTELHVSGGFPVTKPIKLKQLSSAEANKSLSFLLP